MNGSRLAAAVLVFMLQAVVVAPLLRPPLVAAAPRSAAPRSADQPAATAGALETLPLVVRDLPDAPSRAAVAAFDTATIFRPEGATTVFESSLEGLVTPTGAEADVAALREDLLDPQFEGPGGPYPGAIVRPDETPRPPGAIVHAFRMLANADARNADRLTNAAVGYLFMAIANSFGLMGPSDVTEDAKSLGAIRLERFWEFMRAIVTTWPTARAAVLDITFLRSAYPNPDVALPELLAPLERLVAASPGDVTARRLLGDLTARRWDVPDALPRALAILQPLLDDPATETLGRAAVGDAHLATALRQRRVAPFTAAVAARNAIESYTTLDPGDPGVRAGIADALALLGHDDDARRTMEEAVSLAPTSVSLVLELISLQEQAGQMSEMRETARGLLRQTTTAWDPQLAEVRVVPDAHSFFEPGTLDTQAVVLGDRGFGGFSVGRERVPLPFPGQGGFGGGAFFIELDVVPRARGSDVTVIRRAHIPPFQATLAALTASIALADPAGAAADYALWKPTMERFALDFLDDDIQEEYLPAAALVAGRTVDPETRPSAVFRAQTTLRWAGLFDRAADVCRRAAATDPDPARKADDLWCEGESLFLAGRYDDAAAVLRAADAIVRHDREARAYIRLSLAAALERGGHRAEARAAYEAAAVLPETEATGLVKVGDLALEEGDAGAAAEAYSLALAEAANLETTALAERDPVKLEAAHASTRFARNGRGVARIRQAQELGAADRTCPEAAMSLCLGADDDFATAIASDPANPIYRMNGAWSARLMGDVARARSRLEQAVAAEPDLAPALADLGVLAARAGDTAAARTALERALLLRPGDALTHWNLGVLAMAAGPGGIVDGQAHLARAVRLRPEFRDDRLDYKPDEDVYRVTFGAAAPSLPTEPAYGRGFSLAAAGLGAVTVIGAAAAAIRFEARLAGTLGSTIQSLSLPALARAGRALRARRRARGLRASTSAGWRPWLPWLLTLPLLVLVTIVTTNAAGGVAPHATIVLTLLATLLAMGVHQAGHVLLAARARSRVIPAAWGVGSVLAVILAPFNLHAGPFLAEHVFPRHGRRQLLAVWAGPVANLVLAAGAYLLWLVEPLPALRLLASISLAVAAFSLAPYRPLDGAVLSRRNPGVLALVGLGLTAVSLALALGLV